MRRSAESGGYRYDFGRSAELFRLIATIYCGTSAENMYDGAEKRADSKGNRRLRLPVTGLGAILNNLKKRSGIADFHLIL
jgi:hypothetical protein